MASLAATSVAPACSFRTANTRRAGARRCAALRAAPRVTRARNSVQPVRAVASEPKTATPAERQKNPEPEALVSTKSATVNKEQGEDLYKDMYLGRLFEDTCAQMYYRGKMFGFVHLYCGQEAVSTGVIRQLEARDYVCSTYRDHVHAISKGVHPKTVMAELFGKATGICRGQGGSMHMFSADHGFLGGFAFIGEGIPIGLGAAFQSKYRKDVLGEEGDMAVTCSFFGDGTCNVGQFYECLNMATLYKLPHIFVVENNKWAIGMQHMRATSPTMGDEDPYIYKKGPPFGMPGIHVDGMDVLKVREAARVAIERARNGEGPTLIECETYRYRGHSLADPDELRSKEEKAHYAARDPIPQFRQYLLDNKLASEADIEAWEKEIDDVVEESVEFADASPKPGMNQLLENVFSDPRGFGIGENGEYRYLQPGFTSGEAEMS